MEATGRHALDSRPMRAMLVIAAGLCALMSASGDGRQGMAAEPLVFRQVLPGISVDGLSGYSTTFPQVPCSPLPTDVVERMAGLPVPKNLCFVRVPAGTQPDPTRGAGGAYSARTAEIFYVEGTAPPKGGVSSGIAHELCHAHQDRMRLDAGIPSGPAGLDVTWRQTAQAQEFAAILSATDLAIRPNDPSWLNVYRQLAGTTRSEVESFAEVCRAWYFPNPGETQSAFGAFPAMHAFASRWLPR